MNRITVDIKEHEQVMRIDDIVIDSVIFQDEMINYQYRDRIDFIDNLCDWIGEARGNDRELMKEDLIYLSSLEDKYIFSSILTNEYIALSDNEIRFNGICDDILQLRASLVVITKDNIHLYYEFMSFDDKRNPDISDILESYLRGKVLNLPKQNDYFYYFDDKSIINKSKNWDYLSTYAYTRQVVIHKILSIDFLNKHIDANITGRGFISYFGVKDTLKPIGEYIAEIRESSEYEEYIESIDTVECSKCGWSGKEEDLNYFGSRYFLLISSLPAKEAIIRHLLIVIDQCTLVAI